MKKSRTTAYDFGYTGVPSYYGHYPAISTVTSLCTQSGFCNFERSEMLEAYGLLHRTNSLSITDTGFETLWSTERGRDAINDCDHWKTGGFNYPVSGVVISESPDTQASQFTHWRMSPVGYDEVQEVKVHPNLDYSLARRTAWHTMQPEFEGNVAMLNFIFELKDFKTIAKFIAKKPLKKICGAFRRWKSKGLFSKLDPSRSIAEVHLANEFAIKPLISDILEIQNQLSLMVQDAQEQFATEGLEGNTRYYSEDFIAESPTVGSMFLEGYLEKTRFTAVMDYNFKYSMRSEWDAIRKYWGLNLTAEVVWNALPWSFLVDYFVNVGQTISMLDHDKNVDLSFSRYSESLLTQRVNGLVYDSDRGDWVLVNNNRTSLGLYPITGHKSSLFTRRVMSPDYGTVLPRVSLPSKRQWTNVAALIRAIL